MGMDKDIEFIVRKMLDRIAKNGAYNEDDLLFIISQWDRGYNAFQSEIRNLLGIEEV